jgi:hypothetical protein
MRLLMRTHRYLSCATAPLLLFLAISGAWQVFRLQETSKDGSYVAPKALEVLSRVHKVERMGGAAALAFKVAALTAASAFILTAILGVVIGVRLTQPRWLVWLLLASGILLPACLAWRGLASAPPRPPRPAQAPAAPPPGAATGAH